MNSDNNGGLSPSERQRAAAAEIARKKTLAAYSSANSWQQYHSAWQNYYQKYYSDYYSRAAREFVAGERQKLAEEKARVAAEQEAAARANEEAMKASEDARQRETAAQAAEASAKAAEVAAARMANEATVASMSNPASEEEKGIFAARLKKMAAQKAGISEKVRQRRKKFLPIIAGATVVLILLFLQYNRMIFAPIAAYVSPGEAPDTEIASVDPTVTQTVSPDPKLIIPSLNVEVPVAFGIQLSEVDNAMSGGVAQFRIKGASAYPGEIGNLVITGHSAGDIYSSNQYKFIFSGLERLKEGDLIYVNYNSVRYTYQMKKSAVVEPTDMAALTEATDKPMLILVTCTPLGTSRYRLLIYAEQISPDYQEKAPAEDVKEDVVEEVLPQNEPTFFENIWNWLTGN